MGTPPYPAFELSKWYLDAVGESGEVFIGYRANLRWRRLAVSYAAALTGGALEPRTRSSVRSEEHPTLRMGALSWTSSALEVDGRWRGAAEPISRTLYESPEGSVVWRCLLPSAAASVECGGVAFRGLGYAEHLSMTLPPWKLPINTLRWGRFLTPERSIVWIDWEDEGDGKTWVFVDGTEMRGARMSEEEISFEGGRLRLPSTDRRLLRDGRLSHLLRNLPLPLRTRLGARALAIHETKWRTRGVLEIGSAPPAEGWAIHEVVRLQP